MQRRYVVTYLDTQRGLRVTEYFYHYEDAACYVKMLKQTGAESITFGVE